MFKKGKLDNNMPVLSGDVVIGGQEEPLMTAREIAFLVNRRIDSVVRVVKKMVISGNLTIHKTVEASSGKGSGTDYYFDKKNSIKLAAKINDNLLSVVVDRWFELESASSEKPSWLSNLSPQAMVVIEDLNNQLEEIKIENVELSEENDIKSERIGLLENHFEDGGTIPEFARTLPGVSSMRINDFLCKKGWIRDASSCGKKRWRMNYAARAAGRLKEVEKDIPGTNKKSYEITLLSKGKADIVKMYQNGELPMLKNWDGEKVYKYD